MKNLDRKKERYENKRMAECIEETGKYTKHMKKKIANIARDTTDIKSKVGDIQSKVGDIDRKVGTLRKALADDMEQRYKTTEGRILKQMKDDKEELLQQWQVDKKEHVQQRQGDKEDILREVRTMLQDAEGNLMDNTKEQGDLPG